MKSEILLRIKGYGVSFKTNQGLVKAVNQIDLNIYKGEALAVVGESGSDTRATAVAACGNAVSWSEISLCCPG